MASDEKTTADLITILDAASAEVPDNSAWMDCASKKAGDPCPQCGADLVRKDRMFFWRGDFKAGAVCEACKALWTLVDEEIEPLRPHGAGAREGRDGMTGDDDLPPSGRLHRCDACGRQDVWGPNWAWYGSYKQMEEGEPVFTACSDPCMSRREEIEGERRKNAQIAALSAAVRSADRTLAAAKKRLERALEAAGDSA